MAVTQALRGLRQEDYCESEASLDHTIRPYLLLHYPPPKKKTIQKMGRQA